MAPVAPDGVVAVIELALTKVTFVATVPPMVTVAPVAKYVPVMVIKVPPAVGPELGEIVVTEGGAIKVKPPVRVPV